MRGLRVFSLRPASCNQGESTKVARARLNDETDRQTRAWEGKNLAAFLAREGIENDAEREEKKKERLLQYEKMPRSKKAVAAAASRHTKGGASKIYRAAVL